MAMPDWTSSYLEDLRKRSQTSRAYQKHQVLGLEIAETLGDPEHKALYIKLAKMHNPELLLRLAKGIAERPSVRNPGAYFMRLVQELPKESRIVNRESRIKANQRKTKSK